jgi:hypothetical protein
MNIIVLMNWKWNQITKRASRADPSAALLAAPEIAPAGHRPPRGKLGGFGPDTTAGSAKAGVGRTWRASGAPRSTGLVAARAARIHI